MKLLQLALLALALTVTAYAEDGFSGYLDVGVLGVNSNDALMVSGNNEEIDTLSDNPDRFGQGLLIGLFEVNYKKDNVTYHAGTPLESGTPELAIGASIENGGSTYDLSLLVSPFDQVWKDPYVTDRDDTSAKSYGIQLKHEGIGGTPHLGILKIKWYDIDDDEIGDRFSSMKRDGYSVDLSVGYDFENDKGKLTPYVGLTRNARDGDAQSSKGAYLKLMDVRKLSKGLLISGISVSYLKFDEENPIFDKTRDDIEAGAIAMFKWEDPFGLKQKHITFLAGASNRMSNIDFYDATSIFGGITFGFDF